MKRIIKYIFLITLLTTNVFALEMCKKTKCRSGTTIQIPLNETSYHPYEIPVSPLVDSDNRGIIVIPGDNFHVKVIEKKGAITGLKYSEKKSDIEVMFHKLNLDKKVTTLLEIKNNMKKSIVYQAFVNSPATKWLHFHASSCPIGAGKKVFENWPFPSGQILMINVRFAKTDETTCMKY
ncbi:MAG TPA: hypothetical protein VNJ08_13585 [Bacteriovoracaceae bacterium]|nr:hypothetical protein [Bacteriovoracaceae bacterium]